MTATGLFSDGSQRDLTRQATWRSSDPATVSVSPSGVITGVKTGTVIITANVGSVTAATSTPPLG
jgi:uncharacterized protein YjdB